MKTQRLILIESDSDIDDSVIACNSRRRTSSLGKRNRNFQQTNPKSNKRIKTKHRNNTKHSNSNQDIISIDNNDDSDLYLESFRETVNSITLKSTLQSMITILEQRKKVLNQQHCIYEIYDEPETEVNNINDEIMIIEDDNKYQDVPNNIFKVEIIHNLQKKFKPNGRKRYEALSRYTLSKNVKIKQDIDTKIFSCSAEMDIFTLSSNNKLSVEISMLYDESIYGESDLFEIPLSEKLDYKDNGVFCCCGAIYDERKNYGKNNNSTQNEAVSSSNRSNHNINIRIVIPSLRIVAGTVHFEFIANGIDDNMNKYIIEDENDEDIDIDGTDWMLCDGPCKTWSHVKCIGWNKQEYERKISDELYFCSLLCSDTLIKSKNIKSVHSKHLVTIKNINKLSKYRRVKNIENGEEEEEESLKKKKQKKRYRDIYMRNKTKKEKIDVLLQWTKEQLLALSYNIGINVESVDDDELIESILNAQISEQTAARLAEYVAKTDINGIDKDDELLIAELGCGNGSITCKIAEEYPNSTIYAFDINKDKIKCAQQLYGDKYDNIIWIEIDILELIFFEKYIENGAGFDLIVSNPPFERGYSFEYIGSELLKKKGNPNGSLIFLLPEAYFDGTESRMRLSRILNFNIIQCAHMGRWCYHLVYDQHGNIINKSPQKWIADGIWLIQPCYKQNICIHERFTYKSFHPLICD